MPFNVERSCFSNFEQRTKQILNVLKSVVMQAFLYWFSRHFLNLFTCVCGARLDLSSLFCSFNPLFGLTQNSIHDSESRLSYLACTA